MKPLSPFSPGNPTIRKNNNGKWRSNSGEVFDYDMINRIIKVDMWNVQNNK